MAYVEFLRVRRRLVIYAAIIGGLALLAIIGVISSPHHGIDIGDDGKHPSHTGLIPLSILLLIAGYGTAVMGSVFGTALSRERENLSQAWTKPVSRERFALTYMGVDAVALLVGFAVTFFLGELLVLWVSGAARYITFDADVATYLLLGLGVAFAYYGVVAAMSVGIGRGAAVVGLSWPVGFGLAGLSEVHLPVVLHDAVVALNFINPIAYMSSVGGGRAESLLPVALSIRIGLVWLLAVVSCAIAVVIWKRLED